MLCYGPVTLQSYGWTPCTRWCLSLDSGSSTSNLSDKVGELLSKLFPLFPA